VSRFLIRAILARIAGGTPGKLVPEPETILVFIVDRRVASLTFHHKILRG